MKIVCDACQAKYSISDDKVQGKVFKIRCKKCSNIIVVRGGGGAEAVAAPEPKVDKETRVYDYGYEGGDAPPAGDEAVWHVVINQDQVGPMTAAEIQQRFAANEIDAETYIWREGFSDWLPIAQVDTFTAFVASGSTTAATNGREAVSAMFGGGSTDDTGTMRSDPGDLFAAASAQSRAADHDDDGGDLFGNRPAAGAQASAEPKDAKLRGERNENSVLFSLGNLAQLASNQPAPVTSTPSGHATGAAGGEGSGLIDIRSMANAYLGGGAGGAARPAASSSIGSIDDLPVFSGGGFAEPAVFVPTARPANNNKVVYAMIGAVGLLAIVAVILVVVLLKGGGNSTQVAAPVAVADKSGGDTTPPPTSGEPKPTPPTPGSAAAATPPTPGSDSKPATPGSDAGSAQQVATNDHPPPAENPAGHKPPTPAPPAGHKPPTPTPTAHEPAHTGVAAPPTPHDAAPTKPEKVPAGGGGDCDEVGCLLNNNEGACCAKFKKGGAKKPPAGGGTEPPPAAHSDLPDTLDRDMISGGVSKVKARVMACGDKSPAKGQVKVHVKVSGGGAVTSVSVSATPDAALGNCVAAAMQKASFPKTQNGGSFGYPFVF